MIEIRQLTKVYGGFTAVDDVSFTCQTGQVTGFLGPNGAGKSTTMRMMVGLTPPTAGDVLIDGQHYEDLPNPGLDVGVLLDAGAQHGGRTGREVLTLGALTMGLPKARIEEMLELVGLSRSESKRRVRDYSLGMKQRLGLAHALLGDPRVLILDEPANGLDPAGIRWMRDLLRGYAERGGTVLLSSHLLNEVELIADQLVVIGQGRIVAQGDRESLKSLDEVVSTLVTAVDGAALARALDVAGLTHQADGAGLRVDASPVDVSRVALDAGLLLTDLRDGSAGLEDLFLRLTASTQREAVPDQSSPDQSSPAQSSPAHSSPADTEGAVA